MQSLHAKSKAKKLGHELYIYTNYILHVLLYIYIVNLSNIHVHAVDRAIAIYDLCNQSGRIACRMSFMVHGLPLNE